MFPRAAGRRPRGPRPAGARRRAAGVSVLSRVRPPAAEGRPPQTPAAGAQAGHRRRQTGRRPPKVRSVLRLQLFVQSKTQRAPKLRVRNSPDAV